MGRNPMNGEDPSEGRHLFKPVFAVVICVLVSVIVYQKYYIQRVEDAEAVVETWSARLATTTTSDGHLVRQADDSELAVKDPWGNPLRVRYTQNAFQETVTVTSCGPDGVYVSADDIAASDTNTDWVGFGKKTANTVEDVTSSVARGATKGVVSGVVEGVSESLPSGVKERLGIDTKPAEAEPKKQ